MKETRELKKSSFKATYIDANIHGKLENMIIIESSKS